MNIQSSTILLTTLNSTYQHCSFGLRYLKANLHEYESFCTIHEFTIKQNSRAIVEKILSFNPKIVGFGVYIWNTEETLEVLRILKKVAPQLIVVLGGPEVTYETQLQEHRFWSDYIIQGEGETRFYNLVQTLLNSELQTIENSSSLSTASTSETLHASAPLSSPSLSEAQPVSAQIISPLLPEVKTLKSPYSLYTDEDILNRIIYVEASRGCPYRCEYCLSSLDKSVRSFELESFLSEIKTLIARGARQFKFVDRTFNLSIPTSTRILQFFLEEMKNCEMFVHFEMVPDRLPPELRTWIEKFPKGSLQFEVGLQTINPQVSATISRKNDLKKVEENFKYLKQHTGVYSHADLIVGLPGENLESFAIGFNYLLALEPTEIQVGILKRLRGAPIVRHDREFKMVYQPSPPYQILSNRDLDFQTLQRMNRFAKFWDTIANGHHFPHFMQEMKKRFLWQESASFFHEFLKISDQLSNIYSEAHSIAIEPLGEFLFHYIQREWMMTAAEATELMSLDFSSHHKFTSKLPHFLLSSEMKDKKASPKNKAVLPKRQQRFLNITTPTNN